MGLFGKRSDYKDTIIENQVVEITGLKKKIEALERELQSKNEERWKELAEERSSFYPKYEMVEDSEYIRFYSLEENKPIRTHRQFDKSKSNRGWVDKDMPMVTIEFELAPYGIGRPLMIKAPASGFYEADSNKQIRHKEEICRLRVFDPSEKEAAFEELDREEIREAILKKERKKQIERETLDQLIQEGKVFNTYSKKDGNRSTIPSDVASSVWNRDGGRCVMCGSKEELEFDHIIPVSRGGATTFRNLQLLCCKCNRRKSDNI